MLGRLRTGGEGDGRGWDGWMASPTQWTWVWASSRSWWWTGKPGVLQSMGSQRVGQDWVTELNFSRLNTYFLVLNSIPLTGWTAVYLFMYLLKVIWVAFKSQQLRTKLLQIPTWWHAFFSSFSWVSRGTTVEFLVFNLTYIFKSRYLLINHSFVN